MIKTIGIIGCGTIGTALAEYAEKELASCVASLILRDSDIGRVETLAGKIKGSVIAGSIDEVVGKSDLVIEAASPGIVREVVTSAVQAGKDVMVMSVGGILGNEDLLELAREKGVKMLLPSGAIAGVDALKAAKTAGIEKVTIITRKPPKSVKGAPYFVEKGIDAESIKEETVIFDGNAEDAMKSFPKNINVSAILSIAGIGAQKTKVKIVVSPEFTRNSHEIKVESNAGTITTRTENVPSPNNPGTSYLAALAAIASLKEYFDTVRIGT